MRQFGFQWHLTDRCNLRCAHCYQSRFDMSSQRGLDELRLMADTIFSALSTRRISVNLTGGEPMLLPYLFELIDHLDGFPNVDEITVITNGTRADDAILKRLGDCVHLSALKISVESADAAINDAIRGPGNLARVSANLERFACTGIPVVLMVTLARSNIGTVRATIDWARDAGLAGVIFERFIPLGRGRAMANQVLTAREWAKAVLAICASTQAGGVEEDDIVEFLPYRAFWIQTTTRAPFPVQGALCNLGEESMALMPDGTVYPCRRLPIPVGNVLEDSVPSLLESLERYGLCDLKPRLRGLLCSSCDVESCTGCRALAFALTGDVLSDDPQCLLPSKRASHIVRDLKPEEG